MNRSADIVEIGGFFSVLFGFISLYSYLLSDLKMAFFVFGVTIFMGSICFGIGRLLRKT